MEKELLIELLQETERFTLCSLTKDGPDFELVRYAHTNGYLEMVSSGTYVITEKGKNLLRKEGK
jgi:hypothetical protein